MNLASSPNVSRRFATGSSSSPPSRLQVLRRLQDMGPYGKFAAKHLRTVQWALELACKAAQPRYIETRARNVLPTAT